MFFGYTYKQVAKALAAALVALASGLAVVFSDDTVTQSEIFFLIGEVLAAFGVVFAVPNADA